MNFITTRKQGLSFCLASLAAFALLTGCTTTPPGGAASTPPASEAPPSNTPAPTQTSNPSATPSSTETPQSSVNPIDSTSAPKPIDTSSWKTFKTFGVQFSYPSNWKIEGDDCSACKPETHDNPYEHWNVVSDKKAEALVFASNSAMDTDGDANQYKRTELERIQVPGPLAKSTLLIAEHQVRTNELDGKIVSKLQIFLIDAGTYAKRTKFPELDYFFPTPKQFSIFWSTDDFVEGLGFDDDSLTLEQAKEILATPEYATMRAIMLSTKTYK